MTGCLRLALAIHIHQPIGNFEGVFENAYRDSYAPFLEVLRDYPQIPISLHVSGSLLEWLADAHGEYIDSVRALTERGQVEIIGGPFYEPILAGIPSYDRVGQITAYSRYLEQLFGAKVRGMWMPERVWEQNFASDVTRAGIEYTILDDHHFKSAGLRDDQLHGYYLSEDEGRLLKIFPGSEKLRYTIPFAEPHETINYLRDIAERIPTPVVCFGDDGEKFGTWPETKKHVYENGWLRRFFDALCQNAEWLKLCTLGEAVDHVPPVGSVYLPDCSYREMTEWALPVERLVEFEQISKRKQQDPDWQAVPPVHPRRHLAQLPGEVPRSQRDVHPHAANQPAAAANHLGGRGRRAAALRHAGADRALSRTVQLSRIGTGRSADFIFPTCDTPFTTI